MRMAYMGSNYCGQFYPPPKGCAAAWLPYGSTLGESFAAVGLTPEWADVLVVVLAETFPLPPDMEACACPTVAVLVDWQQWADALIAHANAFDHILVDASGTAGLSRLFPEKTRTFCPMGNFSRVEPDDPPLPLAARRHDVAFIGRATPQEQYAGRVEGLRALYPLSAKADVRILSGLTPDQYRDTLCNTKIVVNHAAWSVQQGVNARNFEASVCGALLLCESYNLGTSDYFDEDEVLFYDGHTLADRIGWALTHLDQAQAMADRARKKTSAPYGATFVDVLEEIVAAPRPERASRSAYDVLIGLSCGFGNWGPGSRRQPAVLQAILDLAQREAPARGDDPRWHDLLGVAVAELATELDDLGSSARAGHLRSNPAWSPPSLWRLAAEADPTAAHPLYNHGRYWIARKQWQRASELLTQARRLLVDLGPAAIRAPAMTYPIRTADVSGLDRALTFHYNATPFQPGAEAKRAALLLWRTCELLGDLAERDGDYPAAAELYEAAYDACPHIARTALRKLMDLASAGENGEQRIRWGRRLVALDPLDLPHREELISLLISGGAPDAHLEHDTSLLRKAIGPANPNHTAPVERL